MSQQKYNMDSVQSTMKKKSWSDFLDALEHKLQHLGKSIQAYSEFLLLQYHPLNKSQETL